MTVGWAEGKKAQSEPVLVNVYGSQESIQSNRIRKAGNRLMGSLKGLQRQKQENQEILGFNFLISLPDSLSTNRIFDRSVQSMVING